jgi:hypothetical protein
MKYTKPLLITLLSCCLGLPVSLIASKNALGEGESKGAGATVNPPNLFSPKVDVHFKYSVDNRSFRKLSDGETLRSGQLYRIEFIPHEDCYIRVSQKDSTGNSQPLKNADGIRVKANNHYELPATGEAYYLDKVTGQETIYFETATSPFKKGSGAEVKGAGGTTSIVPLPSDCSGNCIESVTFQHVNK